MQRLYINSLTKLFGLVYRIIQIKQRLLDAVFLRLIDNSLAMVYFNDVVLVLTSWARAFYYTCKQAQQEQY